MQRENTQLTPNFDLWELTRTNNAEYQQQNRNFTDERFADIIRNAMFLEIIRMLCGSHPLIVHSCYRCPQLNDKTYGSSRTSQHRHGVATDFHIAGQTLEETFKILSHAEMFLKIGQLILEKIKGRNKHVSVWIHISMQDYLPPEKWGQILKVTKT